MADKPDPKELREAEQKVRAFAGFEWLFTGQKAFLSGEVRDHLREQGIRVSKQTMLDKWLPEMSRWGDILQLGATGYYIQRDQLVLFFASHMGAVVRGEDDLDDDDKKG